MGKPTGFMEYQREEARAYSVKERIKNFNEFHEPLSREEQRRQGARCMECGVPFCQSGMMLCGMISGCPLNNLIPEWNDLVYRGAFEQAYQRLRSTNNFPEFTSRVCPALCEKACTCSANGDAVTVRNNEYAIVENAYREGFAHANIPKVRTGKKIAVIGSGPSGLAAADQLNQRGHSVTVFERSDRVGGLMMYGIPNMKLEKTVIDRRIEIMKEEGVEFRTSVNVGKDVTAKELMADFDRVILACGASNPRDIKVEGRDAEGIYFAVDFLKSTTKALLDNGLQEGTFISAKGKNVMVIGGGDTGNDCVGTAVRHGAKSVLQLEMMPKLPDTRAENNPWPQWPRVCKTDYGQEEAAQVYGADPRVYQTTVKRFIKDGEGRLTGAVLVKLSYEKDKNSANVIELEALYTKWNRMVSDYMWEKYALANNKEFNAACVDLNNALEYRKTHPLEGGVIRETIKISDTNHVIKEIPYKVLGDELVADGTCILNFVDEQYKNANGDWYKKYTMNVKVIIKVENGIAISKSFSGIHKVWSPDKKVWDRTKGGFLEKTANTLDAKPVVVKTNDMSKIENPSIIISQDYINEYLRFSYERDVSISHLCKEYLKNPTKSQYYLNVLKMPLRPIDTSKIKLVVK